MTLGCGTACHGPSRVSDPRVGVGALAPHPGDRWACLETARPLTYRLPDLGCRVQGGDPVCKWRSSFSANAVPSSFY